jgi:hypothetical protein
MDAYNYKVHSYLPLYYTALEKLEQVKSSKELTSQMKEFKIRETQRTINILEFGLEIDMDRLENARNKIKRFLDKFIDENLLR